MGSINEQFSVVPVNNVFGTITGSVTAVQVAQGNCKLLRFKADPANSGVFLLGSSANTPWPMSAGDDTGWLAASDLDVFWHSNASGTMDYLHYWLQR